ncbi:hypothetical protein MtrunA17_Chr8g0373791 [Medicago truncatula]|uniref:Uncharacterized protein n=1 Tax=Medicago truncatula TaxID=3880 RepID=A0A396GM24_MEDTR|nr:hypothetical protein MtrunA17_Chr8g0373791 [Medicago truncatula]
MLGNGRLYKPDPYVNEKIPFDKHKMAKMQINAIWSDLEHFWSG